MGLRVGETAPAFSARSDDGRAVELSALRGRWVVLFFYPKAGSMGCALEAGRFESSLPEFERLNATVIGVSTDTEASQAKFRQKCSLSFPLLPDGDRQIAAAYGVMGGLMKVFGRSSRQTFLIDPAGNIVHHWSRVNPLRHATDVLAELERIQQRHNAG
ncbi:peroxiredoxin [Deinococcus peraridilitoris]|uniref:thioredoxin-dependent peroxiredoxin n=1 Tax=Deinococcus peraridilitoris (strain DSM 19664 / LMG 22246 / CIP 109416 / KR-200) TaxID=937777 RepID=L0A7H3_DEIPD|nr:peroxiredoxin [Deinococcus peraridilitoris]AFZ69010.1 Peroxiredoxin [Deinococcus peraridilitoris DSM 19664]